MYPILPLKEIEKFLPQIIKEQVSLVGRSPGGILSQFKKYGSNLPPFWVNKRNNFIKRTLAQYRKNPTLRRKLALITWGFLP
jgi:hypothetical protein